MPGSRQNGFEILDWPQDVAFEGAGDALFDRGQDLLWVGHGFRSDAAVPGLLEKLLGHKTAALNLVDPRFYHLDTCLCPLAGGTLMYFPAAFDEKSHLIEALVPLEKRIAVGEDDALRFCCNAVDLDNHVFMNDASDGLQKRLRDAGLYAGAYASVGVHESRRRGEMPDPEVGRGLIDYRLPGGGVRKPVVASFNRPSALALSSVGLRTFMSRPTRCKSSGWRNS